MWTNFNVDMMVNLLAIQAPRMITIFEGFFLSEWLVSGKTLVALGTGVAAVVATPVLLAGAGFMPAGVAAGLIADMRQVHVYYRLAKIEYGIVLNFVFTIIIEC